jgi:hypothetical protein
LLNAGLLVDRSCCPPPPTTLQPSKPHKPHPPAPQNSIDFYRVAREQYGLPTTAASLPIRCPVRILHGGHDDVVPLSVSQSLIDQIDGDDVALTVVKKGEHKLTDPRDLDLMNATVAQLLLQLQRQARLAAVEARGEVEDQAAAAVAAAALGGEEVAAAAAAKGADGKVTKVQVMATGRA